jgi:hypothetical protein
MTFSPLPLVDRKLYALVSLRWTLTGQCKRGERRGYVASFPLSSSRSAAWYYNVIFSGYFDFRNFF